MAPWEHAVVSIRPVMARDCLWSVGSPVRDGETYRLLIMVVWSSGGWTRHVRRRRSAGWPQGRAGDGLAHFWMFVPAMIKVYLSVFPIKYSSACVVESIFLAGGLACVGES